MKENKKHLLNIISMFNHKIPWTWLHKDQKISTHHVVFRLDSHYECFNFSSINQLIEVYNTFFNVNIKTEEIEKLLVLL